MSSLAVPLLLIGPILFAPSTVNAWSISSQNNNHGLLQVSQKRSSSPLTPLSYQKENHNDGQDGHSNNPIATLNPRIDTSFLDPTTSQDLMGWMSSQTAVQRSPPVWVGTQLMKVSPAKVLQESLLSLEEIPVVPANLFSEAASTATTPSSSSSSTTTMYQFDWAWRYCLMKCLGHSKEWNEHVSKQGLSNTHPLRLQVVAIPPHTSVGWHVHPAVELDIPILGTLYCEEPMMDTTTNNNNVEPLMIDEDALDRAIEHSLGTPLSDFSSVPTKEELQAIDQDLSERVSESLELRVHDEESNNSGKKHNVVQRFLRGAKAKEYNDEDPQDPRPKLLQKYDMETNQVESGRCLVNKVGSIHRSYTKDEPCLLFCLGPNVHAHFL